jgi:hypothetical protein
MAKALGVHIIGRGFGESIVLQMPNGGVGLIDCFAPRLKAVTRAERLAANPTLRFLVNHLKAASLAFVGFTHPHEDHGRGLSHILEEFRGRIGEIWVFRAYNAIYLERYMRALLTSGRESAIEKILHERAGTFATELMQVRNLICELTDETAADRAGFRFFAGYTDFPVEGEEAIRFHFLGPPNILETRYEQALVENMGDLVDDTGTTVNPAWQPDTINHNQVSPALLIEYKKTRILLGGDMEKAAWERVLAESRDKGVRRPNLRCRLFKVSHHGSETGYCPGLYKDLSGGGKLIAVLTPFNRHVFPLPSNAGIGHIRPRVHCLFATHLAEACHASGRAPPGYTPFPGAEESLHVPLGWASTLASHPELLGAFDPAVHEGADAFAVPTGLPPEWRHDLVGNPHLARLLRPELRRVVLTRSDLEHSEIEQDCRLSFFFDGRGRELEHLRYVGPCAGEVPVAS